MNSNPVALRAIAILIVLVSACPWKVHSDEMVGFAAETTLILRPEQIVWSDIEEFPGLKVAMAHGNPSEPGLYVMYAKFEPGIMTTPHFHTADRYVTVISGTWWATIGHAESTDATTPLTPGQAMLHTAGTVHFDGARDTTAVVQIVGIGPVKTEYADVKDR